MQILAKSNVLQVLTQLRHLSWTSNSALKVLAEPFWPSSPLNSPLGKYVSLSIDSVSRQVQIHAVKVLQSELKFRKKSIFVGRKRHFIDIFKSTKKIFFAISNMGKKSIFAAKKCF